MDSAQTAFRAGLGLPPDPDPVPGAGAFRGAGPPPGAELVLCVDTLNVDVHFFAGSAASDVAYKALAVNLSDLAAMGATPAWVDLGLQVPDVDVDWLRAFCDGFLELVNAHAVTVAGAQLYTGPLAVTVLAAGHVPHGQSLLRSAARAGDDIYVTGCLGDAAYALSLLRAADAAAPLDSAQRAYVMQRLHRPAPRLAVGRALRGLARAAIDVSDGLAGDLNHILQASSTAAGTALGATLYAEQLPRSAALLAGTAPPDSLQYALHGGDDYELCFTAAAAAREEIAALGLGCTRIGRIDQQAGLRLLTADGDSRELRPRAYDHFAPSA